MNSALDMAAMVIDRLPLAPMERFALGAAFICDIVQTANEQFPNESPFTAITIDDDSESSILKGAAAALLVVEALPEDHPMSLKMPVKD